MARVRIDPPVLIDELVIREYRMDDLEALDAVIVRNREYLLPWVGDWIKDEPIGLERRREVLQGWIDSYAAGADNPVGVFLGDELVGGTGLHDRNEPADVEIGYWVDERSEGRGIATRVSAAMVERAFASPDVERVLIVHNADNVKSMRIPEKLGFHVIDLPRQCGEAPAVVWALARAEWLG